MEELRGLPVANAINEKLIEQIKDIAAIATPVPGGVGSVTTSFFGHMKDELDLSECCSYGEILNAVRDWTEYYNTERYQWDLARLSPVEYYQYLTTGIYPLIIPKAKGENNQSEASL